MGRPHISKLSGIAAKKSSVTRGVSATRSIIQTILFASSISCRRVTTTEAKFSLSEEQHRPANGATNVRLSSRQHHRQTFVLAVTRARTELSVKIPDFFGVMR